MGNAGVVVLVLTSPLCPEVISLHQSCSTLLDCQTATSYLHKLVQLALVLLTLLTARHAQGRLGLWIISIGGPEQLAAPFSHPS